MAIDKSKISEKIFKSLKSFDLHIKLYTEDGESTLNPLEATRFYNEKNNMMVNLETSTEKYLLKVNIGKNNDISEIKPLLNILRKISNTYNLNYVLRTFNKKISPKDFAYQSVMEKFTRPYGTVKTSRQKFENATLCIKHMSKVDETKRGGRSRNIKSIFIENKNNERFMFPYNNINAARAMCVHVNEGGNPYDDRGQHIIDKTKELETLKEFFKKEKKILENENIKFYKGIRKHINELKNDFSKIKGKKSYQNYFNKKENIENDDDDDDEKELLNEFNIELTEDQELNNYLTNIAIKLKEQDKKHKILKNTVKKFINEKSKFMTTSLIENIDDPNNPVNYNYKNRLYELSAWADYYSSVAVEDEIKENLQQISTDIFSYDNEYVNLCEKLLNSLGEIAILETDDSDKSSTNLSESTIRKIVNQLSEFDID